MLEFLGRADQQLKIRGFRVEPGEVEAALLGQPEVAAAAVAGARRRARRSRQASAWSPTSSPRPAAEPPATAELRARLAGRLPEHMLPAAFVWLDAPAAHRQRQARPPGPARTRGRRGRAGLPAAARRARGDPGRPVGGAARARAGRGRGQLLRARRRQHPLDPAGRPGPGAGAGDHPAAGVRAPDRGGARRRGRDRGRGRGRDRAGDGAGAADADPALVLRPARAGAPLQPGLRAADPGRARPRAAGAGAAWRWWRTTTRCGCALPAARTAGGARTCRRRTRAWPCGSSGSTLAGLAPEAQAAGLAEAGGRLQAGLAPEAGELVRAAWFDLGPGRPGRLLLAIHHLAVDGVSWRILLEDLLAAYAGLGRGEAVVPAAAHDLVPVLVAAAGGARPRRGDPAPSCPTGKACWQGRRRCRWTTTRPGRRTRWARRRGW